LALHLVTLVVQHAKRIEAGPLTGCLVQVAGIQVCREDIAVARAALCATQTREVKSVLTKPESLEALIGERDDLGIERRIVTSDSFQSHLLQLSVSAVLRALGSEKGSGVPQLDRQHSLIEAVLHNGAHHACRSFRSQRQQAIPSVKKRVHLLAHDVRAFAHAAHE
jgi:hypothetical protein